MPAGAGIATHKSHGLLRTFGAPASLRSASVGAKRVPLARSALPVFAFWVIALHAHTG